MGDRDYQSVRVVALDADDTLWPTAFLYTRAIERITRLFTDDPETNLRLQQAMLERHSANAPVYGYGALGFLLTLTEAVSDPRSDLSPTKAEFAAVVEAVKEIHDAPVEPFPGVPEALQQLRQAGLQLVIVTKGSTAEQTAKIARSGLAGFVDGSIILPSKTQADWLSVVASLGYAAKPEAVLVVGDSLSSDVHPVEACGALSVWVDSSHNWEDGGVFIPEGVDRIDSLSDLPGLFGLDKTETTQNTDTSVTQPEQISEHTEVVPEDQVIVEQQQPDTATESVDLSAAPVEEVSAQPNQSSTTDKPSSVLQPAYTHSNAESMTLVEDEMPGVPARWHKQPDGGFAVRFENENLSELPIGTVHKVEITRNDGRKLAPRHAQVTSTDTETGLRIGLVLNAKGEPESVYPPPKKT